MPRFSINKMRSAGLRYLAVDKDGQAWAFEPKPHRKHGCHLVLPKEFLPIEGNESEHWSRMLRWRLSGRAICMPVFDLPINLTWDDEPYDIVKNGLVSKENFKKWPDFAEI